MNAEKRQKYFVNQREAVTIRCSSCGRIGTFAVGGLRGQGHSLRVNCPCTQSFAVDLEFRHDFRVATSIPATIRTESMGKEQATPCVVTNRSRGGLQVQLKESLPVQTDEHIVISFPPDAGSSKKVERCFEYVIVNTVCELEAVLSILFPLPLILHCR